MDVGRKGLCIALSHERTSWIRLWGWALISGLLCPYLSILVPMGAQVAAHLLASYLLVFLSCRMLMQLAISMCPAKDANWSPISCRYVAREVVAMECKYKPCYSSWELYARASMFSLFPFFLSGMELQQLSCVHEIMFRMNSCAVDSGAQSRRASRTRTKWYVNSP